MLGPARDGIYRGPALAETWGANGPRVVWQKPVGQGFSGPSSPAAGSSSFTAWGARDGRSVRREDRRPQWSYGYPTAYRDDFGFDEARVPCRSSRRRRLYVRRRGQLQAVSLETGKALWSVDTMRRYT